jgi:hypothetical protein
VKARASSEHEVVAKERMVRELDDQPRKHKVLFDVSGLIHGTRVRQ